MTPRQRRNLSRLLAPRQVAVIGGNDAETVAKECKRIGFSGQLWPVNPKRRQIAGHPCFAQIEDLPEPPDAVFLAIPRHAAIESVARLNAFGAGGAVCYTAGFGELDEGGIELQHALIDAAGDIALVGPNCYGLINYIDRVALWPFVHGGKCPGYGAAIITQSGMLSSDLIMSQRSVPFAYMISAGNQAMLGLEDYIDVLVDKEPVRAIGLHIEGLKDVASFAEAASKAIKRNVPIVALKTGSSTIGAQLTVSHTGSLSGDDDLYQALFDRLGIIRVHTPASLLETLKLVCVSGVPKDNRLLGLTCSGGGATMLADHADKIGLNFPQPTPNTANKLKELLPSIATVSNPLDYTTPIWGDAERLPPVLAATLADTYEIAILVQDYPLPELNESKHYYLNDAMSFAAATLAAQIPAVICSTLPENIDQETRELLIKNGVVPMQGIPETLDAVKGALWYGKQRTHILSGNAREWTRVPSLQPSEEAWILLDEWRGKECLKSAGLRVPNGCLASAKEAPACAESLGFPVVLKIISDRIVHKTDVGAVVLGLKDRREVEEAVQQIRDTVNQHDPVVATDTFLIEQQVTTPVAELLVSIRNDSQFGLAMTLASGGVLTELIDDAATMLLPVTQSEMKQSLSQLKLSRLIDGYRGRPRADRGAVIEVLLKLATFTQDRADIIGEIEINPLFIMVDGVCAIDASIRLMSNTGQELLFNRKYGER